MCACIYIYVYLNMCTKTLPLPSIGSKVSTVSGHISGIKGARSWYLNACIISVSTALSFPMDSPLLA